MTTSDSSSPATGHRPTAPGEAAAVPAPSHEAPTLFEWPPESQGLARRQLDIEQLLAVERTAMSVVEPVTHLWRQLATTTDAAVTPRSLDAALRDALATMSRLLSVNTVALLLANEDASELVVRFAIGLSEDLTIGIGIRAGEGMAGTVLASRQPLVVGDISKIHIVNPVLRNSGLKSVAAVPLLSAGHALGVFYAASYDADRFTTADADLLQMVADRLAAALDRVRLFERERDARREAQQLAARTLRMQRVTAELASTHSAHEAAGVLVDAFADDASAWRAVWLRTGDELELAASSGALPAEWQGGVPAQVAEVVARRLPAFVDDAPSHALVPVLSDDDCVAALALGFDGHHQFTTSEREDLTAIAGQASQAFDRARLAAAQHRAAERATFFARAAQLLAEAGDLSDTLERLADLAVGVLGEICLLDVVGEDGQIARMAAKHRDRARQPLVDRLRTEFAPDPRGEHPAVSAIAEGRASWAAHTTDALLRATTVSKEHFALVKSLHFRSYLTVPLVAEERVVGSLTSISTTRSFGRDDMAFAQELATHVAAVVDNARRYESAFRTSRILQSSLLPPRLPSVAGVAIETRYLTANRGLEVGGDFYDVIALPSGVVVFSVGDVGGHDRGAAAQMGHLRSAARALAAQATRPAHLIASLRSCWQLLGFERIATMVTGFLDPRGGGVVIASAGHYPPLLVSLDGADFLPLCPSPPLGIDGQPPEEWHGRLRPGDVLLGYTDGAIDERRTGSEASMARLSSVAVAGDRTPRAVCDRVVAMLAPERSDDVALLALALDPR